jgi:membrane protein YdbS with pleckstrin-like domain
MVSLRTQVIETIAALMTAAFGVLAALAWNSAITALVTEYLDSGSGWIALMIYAVIVTILAVVMIIVIARVAAKAKAADAKTEEKVKK